MNLEGGGIKPVNGVANSPGRQDNSSLSIALASEEPPLHHHDQLFELNVVVDMETFA